MVASTLSLSFLLSPPPLSLSQYCTVCLNLRMLLLRSPRPPLSPATPGRALLLIWVGLPLSPSLVPTFALFTVESPSLLSLFSLSLSLHSPSPTPPLSPALLLFSRQSREREREKEKQIHKGRRLFFAPFASRPSSLRRMFASFKRKGSGAAAAAAAQPSAVRLQESEEDKGEREGDAARFWRCLSLPLSLARLPSLPATVATKRRMRVNGAHLSSFLFTREREREGGRERKRRGEKQRKVSFLPSHPFPFPFLPPPLRLSHSHTLCHCRRLRWTSTRRPPHTTARRLASTSSTL